MSKYTTEVRYICEVYSGLNESVGYDKIEEVLSGSWNKIFDFDFPMFDENYRKALCIKILKHFYTREIGEETVGLWKLRLNTRMNEIMPYYNQLYESETLKINPLYTFNYQKTHKDSGGDVRTNTDSGNDKLTSSSNSTNDTTINGTVNSTKVEKLKNKYSDTPQGGLTGIENDTYLTNATIDDNNISQTDTNNGTSNETRINTNEQTTTYGKTSTENITTTREYLETVAGNNGISESKLLTEYRETFLNIDMMIINELNDLFINLW